MLRHYAMRLGGCVSPSRLRRARSNTLMARIAITIASLLITAGCPRARRFPLWWVAELDDHHQQLDGREVSYYELPELSLALQLMYPADADEHGRGLWVGGGW